MRKNILTAALFLLIAQFAVAQKNYRVVIDLTSRDSLSQQMAIRWANEVTKAEPTAQVVIVMYGQGTALAVKDKSFVAEGISKLSANKNVAFKICSVAMANQKIATNQLLPNIQTIPDGIYEIVSKQQQGWGYIKVAH